MSYATVIDQSVLKQWLVEKLDIKTVEERLASLGLEEELITRYLKEFKKLRNAARQYRGFVFAALGAFLGFVSCLLTVLNPIPALYDYILYGLTSVAIILIFAGLYFLFE